MLNFSHGDQKVSFCLRESHPGRLLSPFSVGLDGNPKREPSHPHSLENVLDVAFVDLALKDIIERVLTYFTKEGPTGVRTKRFPVVPCSPSKGFDGYIKELSRKWRTPLLRIGGSREASLENALEQARAPSFDAPYF